MGSEFIKEVLGTDPCFSRHVVKIWFPIGPDKQLFWIPIVITMGKENFRVKVFNGAILSGLQ